ncbi:MAG: GyrI-like domain-containing protein [Bacillota bacterium]
MNRNFRCNSCATGWFSSLPAYELGENQAIPEDMEEITIPSMSYFMTHNKKGDDIGHTYHRIYQWFKESEYQPYSEPTFEYFDDVPIKHEGYPSDRDLKDPHFDILIPILKKNEKKEIDAHFIYLFFRLLKYPERLSYWKCFSPKVGVQNTCSRAVEAE